MKSEEVDGNGVGVKLDANIPPLIPTTNTNAQQKQRNTEQRVIMAISNEMQTIIITIMIMALVFKGDAVQMAL